MTCLQTEHKLNQTKKWYIQHYPLCVFCGHKVRKDGELAHLIRRSFTSEIMTLKLNVGLAHGSCHKVYDDNPEQAQYLPRIVECLYITWLLDQNYFYQIADKYPLLFPVFELFPEVGITELDHHGELLQLNYLYSK